MKTKKALYGLFVVVIIITTALFTSCGEKGGQEETLEYGVIPIKLEPFHVYSSRGKYLRYDIVEIIAEFDLNKIPSGDDAILEGGIYKDGELVETVGGIKELRFTKRAPGEYFARWPVPWNPPLGKYEARVKADMTGKAVENSCEFSIAGRKFKPPPKPLCIVNLESDTRFKERAVMGPYNKETGWEQLAAWAEFMGADALFYLTGITKEMYGPTMEKPWYQNNINLAHDLAVEAHKRDIMFGGWVGAYLPYGKTQVSLPYKFSRNLVEGKFLYTLHISLNDENRRAQVVDLLREMNESDDFDYVGIDYIRTGFGGYELVDDFVNELNLETPDDWEARNLEGRMWWLVSRLRARDEKIIRLWQWWRGSKAARTLKLIKEEAGITKPFFCFMLSYEYGHQHGQDPLMMYDAGADLILLMLYDADRNNFDYLMSSWPDYTHEGQAVLIPGISVDKYFLENPWDKRVNQPVEMFNRYNMVVNGFYRDGAVEGLFFHDLDRAIYTRKGELYWGQDYAVAGGAAFGRLREREGAIPIKIRIESIKPGRGITVEASVENTGKETVDEIEVSIPPTGGVFPGKDSKIVLSDLKPGEKRTVKLSAGTAPVDRMHVVSAMATFGDRPSDRNFDLKSVILYKIPKKEEETTEGETDKEPLGEGPPEVPM
jgi:hypothetical protein